VPGDAAFVAAEGRQAPRTRGARVGHRLLGGEGLAGDDEQRLRGVEAGDLRVEVAGVDVGDEAEGEPGLRAVEERLVRHGGAEVAAADPDVDDVADGPAGVALPGPGADGIGERRHAVEHGVHVRNHVAAGGADRRPARGAQRDVQDGAVLGDVDVLAGEHRGAAAREG
jgi:hypothetical protein